LRILTSLTGAECPLVAAAMLATCIAKSATSLTSGSSTSMEENLAESGMAVSIVSRLGIASMPPLNEDSVVLLFSKSTRLSVLINGVLFCLKLYSLSSRVLVHGWSKTTTSQIMCFQLQRLVDWTPGSIWNWFQQQFTIRPWQF
jgi:hypothetical protein